MRTHRWLVTVAMLIVACGPSGNVDPAATTDTAGGEDEGTDGEPGDRVHASAIALIGINPPEVPWAEMSPEDREMDMVARFHPIFREVFQNHDAVEFASFECESCHGADPQARHFEMPNPALAPVPAAGTPAYEAMRARDAAMTTFMEEEVTPHMQTMLGVGAAFTCNGCHPAP